MQKRGRCAFMLLGAAVLAASAAYADRVRVMSFNVESYDNPGSASYEALVRIVQAVNPDVLFIQEANNDNGRLAFQTAFATQYPFRALGAADGAGNKQQTFSRWPLVNPAQLFGGGFSRATIRVDVDVYPENPGPELRLYNVHWKTGSTQTDAMLRLAMAHTIQQDIDALRDSGDPDFRILIGGDFNEQPGEPAMNVLMPPFYDMMLNDESDPNTGTHFTRIASGRNIDHFLVSSTVDATQDVANVFNTLTFNPGPPPPAGVFDSTTASDHLAIYMEFELIRYEPGDLNMDGFLGTSDIGPFVLALTNPAAYRAAFPAGSILELADINGDNFVGTSDIGPFIGLLTGQ